LAALARTFHESGGVVLTPVTGWDSMKILRQALEAARNFKPFSPDEMMALEARTLSVAKEGDYGKYKTSEIFDSTVKHPEWLG